MYSYGPPTYGRTKAELPARTYIQQLCEDTGCIPEDLPEAMNDRENWRERVRDIRAGGTTWWWWWWLVNSRADGSLDLVRQPVTEKTNDKCKANLLRLKIDHYHILPVEEKQHKWIFICKWTCVQSSLFFVRCPWCNGYCRRKWTRRHEFKSWMRLIAFHIALIRLGKVWIQ